MVLDELKMHIQYNGKVRTDASGLKADVFNLI